MDELNIRLVQSGETGQLPCDSPGLGGRGARHRYVRGDADRADDRARGVPLGLTAVLRLYRACVIRSGKRR
jgi:hypothetical protein